jgi:hypothetical protein
MFVGGTAFSIERQTGLQWAIAVVIGFLSIPIGAALRLVPDAPLEVAVGGMVAVLRRLIPWRRRREEFDLDV